MTHSKLQLMEPNLQPQIVSTLTRGQIIDKFLNIKQKIPSLNRETIFTALAIYQKYILKQSERNLQTSETLFSDDMLIATCLWISIKIQSYEKKFLQKVLLFCGSSIQKSQMILAEAQILEVIDYEIPLSHTYSSMILEFNRRTQSNYEKNVQLVAQCLAFYCEAIKMSSDFVLQQELGVNIVICLADRCVSDSRIRFACRQIRRNRNRKNCRIGTEQKRNISIKVYQ